MPDHALDRPREKTPRRLALELFSRNYHHRIPLPCFPLKIGAIFRIYFIKGKFTGGFLTMDIAVLPLPQEKMKAKIADQTQLGFGKHFTDRMFLAEWTAGKGWHDARVKPYEPFMLDP